MRAPDKLTEEQIEDVERLSLRALFIAAKDFAFDAWEVFHQSSDDPKDVAEDVTREMLDRIGGYAHPQRIYSNVDYRKARYAVLPDYSVRQALLVDSKAEKTAGSARLQLSEISMRVRQVRGGGSTDIAGQIKPIESFAREKFLTTTLLAHYHYSSSKSGDGKDNPPYGLHTLTLVAVPNGRLQERYNPDQSDTIWIAGPNAPARGEKFRVRLSFNRLKQKASWRVQEIAYSADTKRVTGEWAD